MAGDWIKVELELPDKPEVHYMAGVLNLDCDAVVGKLLRVWGWFDKHTVDGNADGVTFALLDRLSGVTGFGEAMCLSGWLVQNGHTLTVPNFDTHNGKTAKNRALTARRVGKHKEKVTPKVTTSPLPNALPREEKRREDITHSRFAEFWSAWPSTDRKTGKAICEKKWKSQKLDSIADKVLEHIAAMKETRKWQDGYEPAPLTFINQRHWEDGEGKAAPNPWDGAK